MRRDARREYPRSVVLVERHHRSETAVRRRRADAVFDFIRDSFENKSERTTFYDDEFRSPICVYDVCCDCARDESPPETPKTYNMGGPDRVSRVDMAKGVAAYLANGDATLEATYVGKIARASCREAKRPRRRRAARYIHGFERALRRGVRRRAAEKFPRPNHSEFYPSSERGARDSSRA